MAKKKEEPYFVEVDQNGCKHCGAGKNYTVIGPDGYALSQSWGDEEDASDIAEWLNEAYYHGQGSMKLKKK